MRIAFAHTKGGVGKTTASIMLAAAVEKRGIPVVVYDADPQASASRWAEVAIARDDPLGFEVKRVNAQFLRNLSSDSAGWHIIDTPPGSAAEIQAAIDIADLVIVPTHPSPMDLDRVWPTLEAIEHRMVGVLLVGVIPRDPKPLRRARSCYFLQHYPGKGRDKNSLRDKPASVIHL